MIRSAAVMARGAFGLQKGVWQVQAFDDLRDPVGIGAHGQPARGQRRGIVLGLRNAVGRGVHPDMMGVNEARGIKKGAGMRLRAELPLSSIDDVYDSQ